MRYALHLEAVREFENAYDYYRKILQVLSSKFEDDFDSALDKMLSFPEAWPSMGKDYRRCLLKKFPFGIIYKVDKMDKMEDMCLIFAVMHLHRKPGYWKDRKF